MVKLEYIDTIRYEAGSPKSIFLLADMDQASDRHIAIFGVGLEAFFIHQYLTKKGYLVDCFLDNNPNMAGRFFCEKPINLPNAIWEGNKEFFIVIAMGKAKYLNEVLWQLKIHKQNAYGAAFIETYHAFDASGSSSRLQEAAMEVMNHILCGNKKMNEIIQPVLNVGPADNILFPFVELCWTTTWSHHLLEWLCGKYFQEYSGKKISMLEIGPGKGFFSAVVHRVNAGIDIEWLMFEMEENSTEAVQNKYNWWPASMFKTYYGMIEEPKYRINKKFDIIVMTEVMEHFSTNPKVTICKIADMLKEDGELYLSTPAWGHLPIYDTYDDIPDYSSLDEYKTMYIGHAYQYSREELEQIMDACGLKIERYALTEGNHHNLLIKHK